ncbi:MAG: tryptophan--tRNA ligase [Gammaproteobacteria bacterium AqS3]|nr:tryptophan--tRNA ligase [Gammaproteobacteria bacterium AqS3]
MSAVQQKKRVLTGITTSGTPHLGNYVGAIRPALERAADPSVESFLFLADYHSLINTRDPERVRRSSFEIAATWLACGLEPSVTVFYRQSDVPELLELTWILGCLTAKGLLNRAHAYKAAVDENLKDDPDGDADRGITLGLFAYPVLMAADILMFDADQVPVGRDQIQHLEITRDIAQRFNSQYGEGLFVLPEALIDESLMTLPGLDGRKMSKSYNNVIPLLQGEKPLRQAIMRIVTDSLEPGEPKNPDTSTVFALYSALADADAREAMRADLLGGLSWGESKKRLLECALEQLAEPMQRYQELCAAPDDVEDYLQKGAVRARAIAGEHLDRVRAATGIGVVSR